MTDFNTFEKDKPEYVKIFNEKLYQTKGRTPQQVYDEDLTHTQRTFVDILGMKPNAQQPLSNGGLGTPTDTSTGFLSTPNANSTTGKLWNGLETPSSSVTDNPWAGLGDSTDNLYNINPLKGLDYSPSSYQSGLKPFGKTGGYSQLPPLTQYTQPLKENAGSWLGTLNSASDTSFGFNTGQNNKTEKLDFSTGYLDSLLEKPQQTFKDLMAQPQLSPISQNQSTDSWYTSQLKPSFVSPSNVCLPPPPKALSLRDYPTSIQAGYWNQIARDKGMSFRPYQRDKLFSDLNLQNQDKVEITPSYRTDIENYVPLWSPQSAAERQKYDDWIIQNEMKINKNHEGDLWHPYFDTGGKVTFGKGHMSPDEKDFISHPWIDRKTKMPMTQEAKKLFWNEIPVKRKKYCNFDKQGNLTKCNTIARAQEDLQGSFLSQTDIDELQRADLTKALNQVKKGFSNLNDLSEIVIEDKATDTLAQRQEKQALRKLYAQFAGKKLDFYQVDPYAVMENIDYRFNTGQPFSKTPNKIYNLYQHNFEEAAKHSHRKKPISDERNKWSADMYQRSKNFWSDL